MATIRVSNQVELNAAVARLKDGDVLLLNPGRYAELNLQSGWNKDFKFNQKVTIASADPNRPAEINQMYMRDVSNVTLRDLEFDHYGKNAAGTPSFRRTMPFFIERGDDVLIDSSAFIGASRDGYGTGVGLRLKDSSGITVMDSSLTNFLNGMNISNVSDLKLLRNLVTRMSNDGMSLGGIDGALISRNEFRDFRSPNPDSQHKDNIQFRIDSGEAGSKNIVIRDNVIDSAEVRHGIYFGNELVKLGITANSVYENILIEGNYIRSAQTHGITVFHGNGIYIRDNTVEQNPDLGYNTAARMTPVINVSKWSDNVEISGNDVMSVPRPENSSWKVSGNHTDKQVKHWDGTVYDLYSAKTYGSILTKPLTDGASLFAKAMYEKVVQIAWNGAGDELRFNGSVVSGETRINVTGLDVPGGDDVVMSGFGANTFNSLPDDNRIVVWDGGAAVRIDHLADFNELDRGSDRIDVYASKIDNALVMDVEFGRGHAEIVFHGLGAAYDALF